MESSSIARQADGGSGNENAGGEDIRPQLHGMWASVAGSWGELADYVDERGEAMTQTLLELSLPRAGERALELACGPGGLGLAAAERVAPGGEVVLSDVVPEMTAIAAARATARGLANVSTRVLDLEQIDEPDDSYDVVLCREGLMFAADPDRAAREIRRVLRPGGRLALSVWGPRERNPWLGAVLDAVSAQVGAPVPPPGIPGPFSLQDSERLAALLSGAGLEDVAVSELEVSYTASSFEDWWARTSALAGPLAKLLASLPEEAAQAIQARAREAISAYRTSTGLEIPGVSLIAAARRA